MSVVGQQDHAEWNQGKAKMNNDPTPVQHVVGRYLTAHTWAKNNRVEFDVSLWFSESVRPLLDANVIMPKRFMLYMDAQFPQLWHRILHDYPTLYDESVKAMNKQASFSYARTIQNRRTEAKLEKSSG